MPATPSTPLLPRSPTSEGEVETALAAREAEELDENAEFFPQADLQGLLHEQETEEHAALQGDETRALGDGCLFCSPSAPAPPDGKEEDGPSPASENIGTTVAHVPIEVWTRVHENFKPFWVAPDMVLNQAFATVPPGSTFWVCWASRYVSFRSPADLG